MYRLLTYILYINIYLNMLIEYSLSYVRDFEYIIPMAWHTMVASRIIDIIHERILFNYKVAPINMLSDYYRGHFMENRIKKKKIPTLAISARNFQANLFQISTLLIVRVFLGIFMHRASPTAFTAYHSCRIFNNN